MKKIVFAAMFLSLLSCKCHKDVIAAQDKLQVAANDGCPESGKCTYRIEKNKAIATSKDEFGKLLYKLEDSSEKNVVIFEYSKPGPEGTVDGNYREEVLFEINADGEDFSFQGKGFRSSKMIFGVFCYCKGKAGYYEVMGGSLSQKDKVVTASIPDIVDGQKTHGITIRL